MLLLLGVGLFAAALLLTRLPAKKSSKATTKARSVMRSNPKLLNSTFLMRHDMIPKMNDDLVRYLQEEGALRTPRIIAAFNAIDRADFVPPEYGEYSYIDRPLPLGATGVLLQPTTVAFMLELLQPQEAEKVLHIGIGTGWITALLTYIANVGGAVYTTEVVHSLVTASNENLHKYYPLQEIVMGQGPLGLPEKAPFERIFVSTPAEEVPEELIHQLNIGGTLVIPAQSTIVRVQRMSSDKYTREEFPGFVFVPVKRI
jgi:protein-L-isoaspartate(D-aspartate) O-methyltransferase